MYLALQRWNGNTVCPHCGYKVCYVIEGGKRYKCGSKECYKKFSVTVGTIFHVSNIPLNKWFTAIYIATAHKKGISTYQLAKDIGTSQKTAWFMMHRIRETLRETNYELMSEIVEIDETYMSRKYKSTYKRLSPEMVARIEADQANHTKRNKGAVIGSPVTPLIEILSLAKIKSSCLNKNLHK